MKQLPLETKQNLTIVKCNRSDNDPVYPTTIVAVVKTESGAEIASVYHGSECDEEGTLIDPSYYINVYGDTEEKYHCQLGYEYLWDAYSAIVFINMHGHAPEGFYGGPYVESPSYKYMGDDETLDLTVSKFRVLIKTL